MILIISKGKKARAVLAGKGEQVAQDAETAIFAIARGLLEHHPASFGKLLKAAEERLEELTKDGGES